MRRVKCKTCGAKNEKLAFLSENTKYTLRFAMQIGGLCRAMTIQDVSRLMRLDWHAVKDLDKITMREQLRLAGPPAPRVIGVDEISIRKGHSGPDRRQRSGGPARDRGSAAQDAPKLTWTCSTRP
jgi:transposase